MQDMSKTFYLLGVHTMNQSVKAKMDATQPTALITGATDGIGKAVALELARNGYTLHILGRNPERGEQVLQALKDVSYDKEHQLFLVDLATIAANNQFLDSYIAKYQKLDLVFLNALFASKNISITEDGIDKYFAVGYLSRYLFSLKLNTLLEQADNPRVIHNGDVRGLLRIDYSALKRPNYGMFRALRQSYAATSLLAYFINKRTGIKAKHEILYPGSVNTKQTQVMGRFVYWIMKLIGMRESEEVGKLIVKHILETNANESAGKYFILDDEKNIPKALRNGNQAFDELINFSEKMTNLNMMDVLRL